MKIRQGHSPVELLKKALQGAVDDARTDDFDEKITAALEGASNEIVLSLALDVVAGIVAGIPSQDPQFYDEFSDACAEAVKGIVEELRKDGGSTPAVGRWLN